MMTKCKRYIMLILCMLLAGAEPIFAIEGELGYFGGITTGTKLPKTTAEIDTNKKTPKEKLSYKEIVYITGEPVVVEGTLDIKPSGEPDKESETGSYKEYYTVKANNKDGTVKLTRTLRLLTNYKYDKNKRQMIKYSEVQYWSERITTDDGVYSVDDDLSYFNKSVIEDYTPGVMYYRGDIDYSAVYKKQGGQGEEPNITVDVKGPLYGYNQPWSKTETQKLDVFVDLGEDQLHIKQTPSVTVSKHLSFGQNEPQAISFSGNYREITQNEGMLRYNVFSSPITFDDDKKQGSVTAPDFRSTEQLMVPKLSRIKGHFAEADIKRLYSMNVFDQNPDTFYPNESITKGQFIKALVKAMKIPMEQTTGRRQRGPVQIAFSDVGASHPYYPYAMAAYKAGLVSGTKFDSSKKVTREEAFVLLIRLIGLERLGFTYGIYTPFVDDANISDWAKQSIYAGATLGLFSGDKGRMIHPNRKLSKAEAAALINRVINYLRYDIKTDYQEKIMMD